MEAFRVFIKILFLTSLFCCSDRQASLATYSVLQKEDMDAVETSLRISATDAMLPLFLDKIKLEDRNNTTTLSDEIVSKIKETIWEYYHDIQFYDCSLTYMDTYIHTIRLQDSAQTVFLIILKHYLTGEVNSIALFYDNEKKEFADSGFEFKLYALYNFENDTLNPTFYKTNFEFTSPEIELVDFNKDGINDYKFKRLLHNGTSNSIHTTILAIKNGRIDTLYFCEQWLGEFVDENNCSQ